MNKNEIKVNEMLKSTDQMLKSALKVLWRIGVSPRLCSQNGQAEWVLYLVGPYHLSIITRLDWRLATAAIPALSAKKCNFTFTFRMTLFIVQSTNKALVLLIIEINQSGLL